MSASEQDRERGAERRRDEQVDVVESTRAEPDSYEGAVERLELIIDRLDSGQAGLRETLELCREGKGLVEYCAAELDAVGEGLRELRLDELAARLEEEPDT